VGESELDRMDQYFMAVWFALFIVHQVDEMVKSVQARKRRKLIAMRLRSL
jgi:hypothetical protein